MDNSTKNQALEQSRFSGILEEIIAREMDRSHQLRSQKNAADDGLGRGVSRADASPGEALTKQIYRASGRERAELERRYQWERDVADLPYYALVAGIVIVVGWGAVRLIKGLVARLPRVADLKKWWSAPSTPKEDGPLMPLPMLAVMAGSGVLAGLGAGHGITYTLGAVVQGLLMLAGVFWGARWLDGKPPIGGGEEPPEPRP